MNDLSGQPPATGRLAPAVAVVAAVVGIVATFVRPLAPPLPASPVPQERFGAEVLAVVAQYQRPRLLVALVLLAATVLVPLALLAWPRARGVVDRVVGRVGARVPAAALVGIAIVLATRLVTAPLSFWAGHVREVAWGFRTADAWSWWRDWLLEVTVEAVVAGLAVATFAWLVGRRPADWHWWLPVGATVLAALLTLVHPLVIQPLFLDTVPLPPGEVRSEVEEVLRRAGVEAEVLVADASRRTTRVNAFVTGLGPTRQVVLWDTLLRRPADEVAVVVAHELAHRVDLDLARGVMLTSAGVLPFALVLRRILGSRRLQRTTGAADAGDPRMVVVLAVAIAAAQVLGLPAAMWASRRAEAAADHLALEWTREPDPLVRSFRGFVVRDLARPDPGLLQLALFGSHPALEDRIRAAVTGARSLGVPVEDLAHLRRAEADQHHPRVVLP